MKILGMDTSSKNLTLCLIKDTGTVGIYIPDSQRTHSEILMNNVDKLLSDNEVKLEQLDAIGVVVGPGSFTGIRIGVTTVRAFCQICDKPAIRVTSLKAMAYNDNSGKIVVVNAMNQKYYYAVYGQNNSVLVSPQVVERDNLATALAPYANMIYADCELDFLNRPYRNATHAIENLAGALLDEYQAGRTLSYESLVPLYVRLSQAEENVR